jgi:hypothetical protein
MKIREMLYKSGFCMKIREMPADIKVQCQKVGFIVWIYRP